MSQMNSYLVGGAVRDALLGIEVKDRDFVVLHSTADELLSLGYEQVGMGYPVFLHPETREEYALARREKKVGSGYTGFEFETDATVTLREDLSRRDLTINSMAMDANSYIIDPFGGLDDLKQKVLRHTSDAFAEDPLRVVRLARFFARYANLGFSIAPGTMDLASQMVDRGDLDELPDERFWLEVNKAFSDKNPAMFFELLFEIGALNKVSFFKRMFGGNVDGRSLTHLMKLAAAVEVVNDLELRSDIFAAWVAPDDTIAWFSSGRAAHLFTMMQEFNQMSCPTNALEVLNLLTHARAFGEGTRVHDFINALIVWESVFGKPPSLSAKTLLACLAIARSVTSEPFMHLQGKDIGAAMAQARVKLIASTLNL